MANSNTDWNRVMRVVVCIISMGFIFPNAMTETSDAREVAKTEEVAKK